MRQIGIVTATRAEWGQLRPLAQAIQADPEIQLVLLVTGTHWIPEYGDTYQEILSDGFSIDERVDMQLFPASSAAVTKTMGLTTIGFADVFQHRKLDALIVLGDRYETLAVCLAAMNEQIPIVHLHGGETTEGAVDEGIRHAITKLSALHFTSCQAYRNRVIQLGEAPERVWVSGALSADNIRLLPLLSREALSQSIGFDLSQPYAVATYHPVTLGGDVNAQIDAFLSALEDTKDLRFLITKSNADVGATEMNARIDAATARNPRIFAVESLGTLRYLSALSHAEFMIGNSSSGITEGSYFHIPTVDIGDRQKGRLAPPSIIHCAADKEAILAGIQKARSSEFRSSIAQAPPFFGDGHAAEIILQGVKDALEQGISIQKPFYDLPPVHG